MTGRKKPITHHPGKTRGGKLPFSMYFQPRAKIGVTTAPATIAAGMDGRKYSGVSGVIR
jgi:hypothetical protein